jgi:hypothetical protein
MDDAKSWSSRVEISSEMTGLVRPTSKVYKLPAAPWARLNSHDLLDNRPQAKAEAAGPRRIVPGLE